ncbi:inner centromere protein isoform X2 [Melopsittacus undulatus]|uniref:inner centromere protein isoform X2 n=1 Tax=Melopsittacus undulatus TaxID=13146 RepID=UPI00146B9494|nr:inner centromere protein isoform X2 [Melopsittacus undulatus]
MAVEAVMMAVAERMMAAAAGTTLLPAMCNQRLAELLRQVDEVDMVWLREISEEAERMFKSHYSDEPELMPKTPSQKSRQRRKRLMALQENREPNRKRLSRRKNSSLKLVSSARRSQRLHNKENLELIMAEATDTSPPRRVTRSQAAQAKSTQVLPQSPPVRHTHRKASSLIADGSDPISAAAPLRESAPKAAEQLPAPIVLSTEDGSPKESSTDRSPPEPVPAAFKLQLPCSPDRSSVGANGAAPEPGAAEAADAAVAVTEQTRLQEAEDSAGAQPVRDPPSTPKGSRLSRRSVRRSLMGKPSLSRRTSLAEKYSLASRRESARRSSAIRRKAARASSMISSSIEVSSCGETLEEEETVLKPGPSPGPCTPSKPDGQSLRMSLRSRSASRNKQQQEGTSTNESNLNKSGEAQQPPQSARRKPSYKRAVDERYDQQQAEEGGLSPLRKKSPSPGFPASKVVRPFKTFLHTVQKNQLLMTPCSVGRNGVIKSFIKHNTPLRSDPKEKERQKLETLRKKQQAEQLRKQKLEEEKKRRLEEAKLKREERLRKVLQARERAEQMEEERKRRIEQKIALFDEKTEKVREERLAEEKIKKKAAARKMEEAEARRRQEEEARRQRALQQEEEERRHKELMQKRKEEEQERARRIAEQRQAEQEREKQLAAERELERKKEQERIQAEKLREQEKAARLKKEVLAAKLRLQKELEKKEEEQRLAEMKRQEQEQKKLAEKQQAGKAALTQHQNSPACTSYQMTPQGPKCPKPPVVAPTSYGMDVNSDDSTDDESQPRKPIPAWASRSQLNQAVLRLYYNPPSVDAVFGTMPSLQLQDIFYKSKPRYLRRTSSAVWNSPPFPRAKPALGLPCSIKKY